MPLPRMLDAAKHGQRKHTRHQGHTPGRSPLRRSVFKTSQVFQSRSIMVQYITCCVSAALR